MSWKFDEALQTLNQRPDRKLAADTAMINARLDQIENSIRGLERHRRDDRDDVEYKIGVAIAKLKADSEKEFERIDDLEDRVSKRLDDIDDSIEKLWYAPGGPVAATAATQFEINKNSILLNKQ